MLEATTVSTHGPAHEELADLAAAPSPLQPAFEASMADLGRFVGRMRELEKVIAEECAVCGSPVLLAFGRAILVGTRRYRYHDNCLRWSRSMPEVA